MEITNLNMRKIKKLTIIGNNCQALITAMLISRRVDLEIEIIGHQQSSNGVMSTSENIWKIAKRLGIPKDQLISLTDSTYRLGVMMSSPDGRGDNFWPINGFEVKNFHEIAEFIAEQNERPELYSLAGMAAVNNKFSEIKEGAYIKYGAHCSSILFEDLLREQIQQYPIKIVQEAVKEYKKTVEGVVDQIVLESGEGLDVGFIINAMTPVAFDMKCDIPAAAEKRKRSLYSYQYSIKTSLRIDQALYSSRKIVDDLMVEEFPVRTGTWCVVRSFEKKNPDEIIRALSLGSVVEVHGETIGNETEISPWNKNVVDLGQLTSSIDSIALSKLELTTMLVDWLIELWPDSGFSTSLADEYNRIVESVLQNIRDFNGLMAWSQMSRGGDTIIPENIRDEIESYRQTSRIGTRDFSIFSDETWCCFMAVMGIYPQNRLQLGDSEKRDLMRQLTDIKSKNA